MTARRPLVVVTGGVQELAATDTMPVSALPAHASTHASAGSDPVTPAAIGAAATTHTHAESDITSLVADLAAKASVPAAPTTSGTTTGTATLDTAANTRHKINASSGNITLALSNDPGDMNEVSCVVAASGASRTITVPGTLTAGLTSSYVIATGKRLFLRWMYDSAAAAFFLIGLSVAPWASGMLAA